MKQIWFFYKRLHTFSGNVLYLNMLAMIIIGLLESVGTVLLLPLISIAGFIELDIEGTILANWFTWLHGFPKLISLTIVLLIYVSISIVQNIFQRNLTIKNVKIMQAYSSHLRMKLYESIMNVNWEFFMKKRKTDLIHSLTSDLARVTSGIVIFLQLLSSIVFTIIQIALAFWLAPSLTIFVLIAGMLLGLYSRKFIKQSKALGNNTSQLGLNYLSGVTDQLNGIKDVKSNQLEKAHINWLRNITQGMTSEQINYIKLNTASQLSYKISSSFLIALFIFLSVMLIQAQQGQLLLIIIIFSRLWPRFTGIQGNVENVAASIPAFLSIQILEEECAQAKELSTYTTTKQMELKQAIECRNVSFKYNKEESNNTLKNINLYIPAREMTAIVGPSGAGKSTLIDLVMGLIIPDRGDILVDGMPLTDQIIFSLRKSISYVSQDPFLFNESIKRNLQLVDETATEEQLWEALEFASAADFVRKLPQGLDTVIGDRGVRLSGGERQRIVLARAILRKPSILVLDEATSALDTENEARIQEALERLKGKMTIIIIAHRLSTIRNADQVIVLNQGKIIQQGGFNELAREKKGMFSHLLGNQQIMAINE